MTEGVAVALALLSVSGALITVVIGATTAVARTRSRAAAGRTSPGSRRVQAVLHAATDRLVGADDPLGLARRVRADRAEITADTIAAFTDPDELLVYLWFVRPSQTDGFATSPPFAALPVRVQDAIVLLDVRRMLRLPGGDITGSGPYAHSAERIGLAVARSGTPAVAAALDDPERLAEVLDDPETWRGMLEAPRGD